MIVLSGVAAGLVALAGFGVVHAPICLVAGALFAVTRALTRVMP